MVIDLVSWMAITDTLSRYVHVVDAGDWARLDEVFTVDAVVDHTAIGGLRMSGLEEVASGIATRMKVRAIAHHLMNPMIESTSDDGESVSVSSKWLVVDDQGRAISGYYADKFVKQGDKWQIVSRTATPRFS